MRLIDRPPREPAAWLYVVAGNPARDDQRREGRRARHVAIGVAPTSVGLLPSRAQQRFIRAFGNRAEHRGSDARASG